MLKHRQLTHDRISKFVCAFDKLFWTEKVSLEAVVSQRTERISYEDAMKLKFHPATKGMEFGPRFATYWFKVSGEIPTAWRKSPVDLVFNTGSEATVWLDGKPVQGVNPASWSVSLPYTNRFEFRLPSDVVRSGKVDVAVEMACNNLFGEAHPGEVRFEEASLALFDPEAWELFHDLFVPWQLLELRLDKTKVTPWEGELLAGLNEICNRIDPTDRTTWALAKPILKKIYSSRNASTAIDLSALGHAHIDTAWLWPLAETRRKCMRSFSTALKLMAEYPEYKFSCPQAVQYQWMKDHAPTIFAGIKAAVKRGQWVPVGGSWVEPDSNMPSGESLARQFIYGQRFFQKEFGWHCKEGWNPDMFGYSGQLPQILKLSGIDYFLTSKLSQNQFNKPQHQNFIWRGIDGSGVLTHFPPADDYSAMRGSDAVRSLRVSETNHQDLDRTREGMLLFGWGDGGGGPSRHMLEVLRRTKDFQGLPRIEQRSSLEFFQRLEKTLTDPAIVVGELYLECHRATYTTQAVNKRDNRLSEHALRRVELLSVLATQEGWSYPQAEIERVWKIVLLNQFHDILPGSSIAPVYQDSAKDYADVFSSCERLEAASLKILARTKEDEMSVFNPLGWERLGLVEVSQPVPGSQKSYDGKFLSQVVAPSMGSAPLQDAHHGDRVQVISDPAGLILENQQLRATFSQSGQLTGVIHLATGREVIAAQSKANQFVLFDDKPLHNNAWDVDAYHLETRQELPGATRSRVIEKGPLRAGLEFDYSFGSTRVVQRVFLATGSGHLEFDTEVDWHYRHKFLKVEFPVDILAREASYEIPFGLVRRTTTFNNTYEMGQFEVCGQRWADLSQPGFGAALFTDNKYGYACHGNVLRLSLLRGAVDPNPDADIGKHRFRYAFYPHSGDLVEGEVVRRAHEFNQPFLPVAGRLLPQSHFSVDSPHLILDTVKKAEDSTEVIVRLYECHGSRGKAKLMTGLSFQSVVRTNLLEEPTGKVPFNDGSVELEFGPFEIITLKLGSKMMRP